MKPNQIQIQNPELLAFQQKLYASTGSIIEVQKLLSDSITRAYPSLAALIEPTEIILKSISPPLIAFKEYTDQFCGIELTRLSSTIQNLAAISDSLQNSGFADMIKEPNWQSDIISETGDNPLPDEMVKNYSILKSETDQLVPSENTSIPLKQHLSVGDLLAIITLIITIYFQISSSIDFNRLYEEEVKQTAILEDIRDATALDDNQKQEDINFQEAFVQSLNYLTALSNEFSTSD